MYEYHFSLHTKHHPSKCMNNINRLFVYCFWYMSWYRWLYMIICICCDDNVSFLIYTNKSHPIFLGGNHRLRRCSVRTCDETKFSTRFEHKCVCIGTLLMFITTLPITFSSLSVADLILSLHVSLGTNSCTTSASLTHASIPLIPLSILRLGLAKRV